MEVSRGATDVPLQDPGIAGIAETEGPSMARGEWTVSLSLEGSSSESPGPFSGLLRLLGGPLVDADVGLGVIRGWLEAIRDETGTSEAIAVLESPSIGRQVFTATAAPLRGDRVQRLVLHAGPGLYTDPAVSFDPDEVSVGLRLCRMAFELDVNRGQSVRDPLTGLLNRRGYGMELTRFVDNATRYGWPFALVLIDLDDFKALNDRYGHPVGDEVLERLGRAVDRQLRSGDVAARLGGDEFALLLGDAHEEAVSATIERLRQRLDRSDLPVEVSLSWGWVACPHESAVPEELYRVADTRLYQHKRRSDRSDPEPAGAR